MRNARGAFGWVGSAAIVIDHTVRAATADARALAPACVTCERRPVSLAILRASYDGIAASLKPAGVTRDWQGRMLLRECDGILLQFHFELAPRKVEYHVRVSLWFDELGIPSPPRAFQAPWQWDLALAARDDPRVEPNRTVSRFPVAEASAGPFEAVLERARSIASPDDLLATSPWNRYSHCYTQRLEIFDFERRVALERRDPALMQKAVDGAARYQAVGFGAAGLEGEARTSFLRERTMAQVAGWLEGHAAHGFPIERMCELAVERCAGP